jgi:mycothiol synthase
VPPFPHVDKTHFRYFQPDDAAAIHRIIHACQFVDGIDPLSTLESLPTLQEVVDYFDSLPHENILIAEKDGQVVGYNRINWWTESDGITLYLHLGRLLPDYRQQGLGTAFLHWSEAVIRELAEEHQSKAVYGSNASSTEIDATKLLRDNGYQAVFTLAQMVYEPLATVETMALPDGVRVTAAEAEQAETLWLALRAAWDEKPAWGMPAVEREEAISEIRESIMKNGHLWKIVWEGDKVAAQVWCSIKEYGGRKAGFLDEVHTVPEFRRRGMAQLAINRALLMFREMGAQEGRLHTDDNNSRGAKSLYEKVGFKTLKTFPRYRKDV